MACRAMLFFELPTEYWIQFGENVFISEEGNILARANGENVTSDTIIRCNALDTSHKGFKAKSLELGLKLELRMSSDTFDKGHRDRFSWPTDIEREPRYTAGVVPAQFFIHSDIPEKEVEKAPYHLSFVEASTMTKSSLNLRPAAIIGYDKNKDKERGKKGVPSLQTSEQR